MDVPIPCACTLDTSLHPSGLKTSLRLYGLVRIVGFGDMPASTPVEILCAASGEGKAIRAFVSRLDAELVARSMPDSGYRVVPLAQFDPTGFIQQHRGWLTVHITYGFSSQRDTLRLADGDLPSLGWFIYAQTGPWSPGRFIHWGEESPRFCSVPTAALVCPITTPGSTSLMTIPRRPWTTASKSPGRRCWRAVPCAKTTEHCSILWMSAGAFPTRPSTPITPFETLKRNFP